MSKLGALAAVSVALVGCLERGTGERVDASSEVSSPPTANRSDADPIAVRADPSGSRDPAATIRIRLEAEPSHLNPMLSGDGVAVRVALGDIYEGLLCRASPLEMPTPCLAKNYAVDVSGTEWTFEVRRGVRFHDGSLLEVADVIASIEAVARAEIATPLTAELDDLESVTSDGQRIIVRFRERRLDRLGTFVRLPIARKSQLIEVSPIASLAANRSPIGTGPLAFDRWDSGVSIQLRRFADYWGEPSAAALIDYRILDSRERAYAMARNGKLDVAAQLPVAEALGVATLSGALDVFTYARPAYLAAVYNTRAPGLRTAQKRLALTGLLDRVGVIRAILAGRAAPISGPYIGEEADPSVRPPPFDPRTNAGVFEVPPTLRLLYPVESRTMARVADIWAADARGAVKLVPTPLPFGAVLERARAGDFDIVLLAFTTGRELDMYSRLHSSQVGGENYGAIRDAALDEALEAVRVATTPAALIAATRRCHRLIAELAPYAFIASDVRGGLVSPDVGGLLRGDSLSARFLWKARAER